MHLYDKDRFIGCRRCGELLPLPDLGTARSPVGREEAAAARDEFLRRHAAHDTTEFVRHGSPLLATRPLWDPLTQLTFEITDGAHVYLATADRPTIDEPRMYRFGGGRLTETATAVDVDARDLERALELEFYPHALRQPKVKHFVRVVQDIVQQATPDDIDFDDAFDDAADPAVCIAPLPESLFAELVQRCREIFDPWELDRVLHFLRLHRGGAGVLALRVRRELTVVAA